MRSASILAHSSAVSGGRTISSPAACRKIFSRRFIPLFNSNRREERRHHDLPRPAYPAVFLALPLHDIVWGMQSNKAGARPTALLHSVFTYLTDRGVSPAVIKRFRIRWWHNRIAIPISNQHGTFAFYKLARSPDANPESPKMLNGPGGYMELYGWENVLAKPDEI